MSTYFPSGKDLAGQRKWYVVDAAGQTVGHLASEIASILSGKRSPRWTPFMDLGDHVIVINARKAVLKGAKPQQKLYRRHTLYPGGLREVTAEEMFAKRPDRVISLAVQGMLPKSKLGKAMAKKLKVYADADHPHTAQRPEVHTLTTR
ncbi:MAG: large subunit ribosomal protein [Pyrinomonadaceae bacterium]|jgi:large subunit ribosomal protein L13|nr:large subunit ribosomal protein [Pyrinomonadaceae bacterium]